MAIDRKDKQGIILNRKEGFKKNTGIAVALNQSDWRGLNRNQDQNAIIDISKKQINRIQYDTSDKGYNSQQDRLYLTDGVMCSLPNANPVNKINILTGLQNHQSIRRLTPKECFRLMGFLDDQIDISGLSDTQAYKLAGNGWEIQVVSKILLNLYKAV